MNPTFMQIPARAAITYPIHIGFNFLDQPHQWLPMDWQTRRWVIITDDTVNQRYGERLQKTLHEANPLLLTFAGGEPSKNYDTVQFLIEQMFNAQCDRETTILALGGGVVGDVAGFVASVYMRGVPYIQLPTTLLAMVDSSVGGKTAINLHQGKNLMGTFWQPTVVVIDPDCLRTLTYEHRVNGLMEALKMFMTHDADSFYDVFNHLDALKQPDVSVFTSIIERALKIKIDLVSRDEGDHHERMLLNFGHTVGHALEKVSDYQLLHGFAVALGILVEAKISQLLGFLSEADYAIIVSRFHCFNISGNQLNSDQCDLALEAMRYDKKMKANQTQLVLLKTIGQVCDHDNRFVYPVDDEIVKMAFSAVMGKR